MLDAASCAVAHVSNSGTEHRWSFVRFETVTSTMGMNCGAQERTGKAHSRQRGAGANDSGDLDQRRNEPARRQPPPADHEDYFSAITSEFVYDC